MSREKDTTIWKPKGNQKISNPSGPAPRGRERRRPRARRRAPEYSSFVSEAQGALRDEALGAESQSAAVSGGYDAPSSTLGKLGLLLGAGAIIAALAKGVKNSDYFND